MRRALAKAKSIAQLCREYGISRKTGHKWINRYRAQGSEGLVDGRRRYVGDEARCEPLMVRDAISRFVLALRLLPGRHYVHARAVFEELFAQVGLPRAIRAHGPPFLSPASLGGLTQLSAWWVSLGIGLPEVVIGSPPEDGSSG